MGDGDLESGIPKKCFSVPDDFVFLVSGPLVFPSPNHSCLLTSLNPASSAKESFCSNWYCL